MGNYYCYYYKDLKNHHHMDYSYYMDCYFCKYCYLQKDFLLLADCNYYYNYCYFGYRYYKDCCYNHSFDYYYNYFLDYYYNYFLDYYYNYYYCFNYYYCC